MRLTEKEFTKKDYDIHNYDYQDAINKLGQLEDIEEEYGVDLVTLFKALKNGFWVKEQNKNNELVHIRARLNAEGQTLDFFEPNMSTVGIGRNIFQYGKTWSLDKKDLLKEELL